MAGRRAVEAAGRKKPEGGYSNTFTSTPVDTPSSVPEPKTPSAAPSADPSADPSAAPTEYQKPKDAMELASRQNVAASISAALSMDKGRGRKKALQKAKQEAEDLGIPKDKVDSYIDRQRSQTTLGARQQAAADLKRADELLTRKDQKRAREEAIQMARKAGVSNKDIKSFIEREIDGPKKEVRRKIQDLEVKIAEDPENSERYFGEMLAVMGEKAPSRLDSRFGSRRIGTDESVMTQIAKDVASGKLSPAAGDLKLTKIMEERDRYNNPNQARVQEIIRQRENARRAARGQPPLPRIPFTVGSTGSVGRRKNQSKFYNVRGPRDSGGFISG
jgi:hypothetical protein